MPMMRFATATIVRPKIDQGGWSKVRTAASHKAEMPKNLIDQASEIFGKPFKPDDYLLTHATIVASVDTEDVPNVRLGSEIEENGFKVNRQWANYRITNACDKFINNNMDAWSRPVLLKSFRTFIGAHNFQEHVQIEDLSKGRVIDAVARDIGDSVYVDILIATDRTNAELVSAIEEGRMATMSMGCQVDGTICTKCGHWAADETEMCRHIRYEKGNTFFDENGQQHRIAELCGHEDIDPHAGVQFIEASWVDTPAFTGAVARNILTPDEIKVACTDKACTPLSEPPVEWDDAKLAKVAADAQADIRIKTAFTKTGDAIVIIPKDKYAEFVDGKLGQWGDEEEEGGAEEAPAEEADPIEQLQEEIEGVVLERVEEKLREKIRKEDLEQEVNAPDPSPEDSVSVNDSIGKDGMLRVGATYKTALQALVLTSRSDADLMDRVASLNYRLGIDIPVAMYRTALQVGFPPKGTSAVAYLSICEKDLGRRLASSEKRTLVRLGTLLGLRGNLGS